MQSSNDSFDPDAGWDDYRVLLVAERTASFQAAAHELATSTSTVSRRISAWERRLGTKLFERRPHGVVPTAAGRLLAAVARKLQDEMQRGEHALKNLDPGLAGKVRITAGEGFGEALVPLVAEFRALRPQIDVELAIDTRTYNLAQGEADLAIRIPRPPERGLLVRKLGTLRFGLFASSVYLLRRGTPESLADLASHDFIGFAGTLADMLPARFLRTLDVERFAVRVNSTPLVRLSALNHLGIGVLVTATNDLVRVLPERASPPLEVWLARHPSTRSVRRVDAFSDFLAARVKGLLESVPDGR
jgi:DNA-binding transcriptional LysR family regulator